jgi:hypothetical protein
LAVVGTIFLQQEIWDQAIWDFCNNICQVQTIRSMNAALAIIHSMQPQSELQALLVTVQIIATGFSGYRDA